MQSQRLLFKPADHNQLQPIQLLSTCNTWYQEKCAQASANNAAIQTSTRCRLCAHASVCACRHAGWPAGYSPGWLVVMSDWLPAGFITLRQRQKQTLWPPHLQVSLSLCFSSSLSLSVPRCLPLSPIEPSFEASVGWLWFCLAGRAVGKHFDWRDRTKAHTAIFEAAVLVRKMVSQMIRTWQRNPREDTNARAYGMVYSCDNRSADRNSCGTCNVCRSKQTSLSLASSSICFSIF